MCVIWFDLTGPPSRHSHRSHLICVKYSGPLTVGAPIQGPHAARTSRERPRGGQSGAERGVLAPSPGPTPTRRGGAGSCVFRRDQRQENKEKSKTRPPMKAAGLSGLHQISHMQGALGGIRLGTLDGVRGVVRGHLNGLVERVGNTLGC
jgi:hypothetical protein